MTLAALKTRIARQHTLDFGDIFGKAIDLFKNVWVEGLLFLIINFGISFGLSFLLQIGFLFTGLTTSGEVDFTSSNEPVTFVSILFMILTLALSFVTAVFQLGLQAAYYRLVRLKDRGVATEPGVNWGMFLRKQYVRKLMLLALFVFLIAIGCVLLCVVPIIYAFVPLQFVALVFAFNPELSAEDVIKGAFELGNRRWFISFGLLFIGGLLAGIIGFILCGIGLLFTSSFVYVLAYQVYKESVGFDEIDHAIESIGQ